MNTAEAKPKEKSYFAELLDWMTLKFDGDMGKLAEDAMKYVKKKQYAFGPLWDEIGERALRILFAERLRIERNNFGVGSTPSVSTQVGFEPTPTQKDGGKATTIVNNQKSTAKSPKPSVYLTWFHNPRGKGLPWINLGDMTREDCELLIKYHKDLADANAERAVFFSKLTERLKGTQTVKEVFGEDELRQMMTWL